MRTAGWVMSFIVPMPLGLLATGFLLGTIGTDVSEAG